ncbi:relaxase/mobilization nuclease domain-containing protein [Kocuria oceani]
MIAKITRGSRAGDIAAYLHGPGKTAMHTYHDRDGAEQVGGIVIGGTLAMRGDTTGRWAAELREAAASRPEITKPIWQVSLRCAPEDRALTDAEWRDAATVFMTRMGLEDRPWVVVRHADDHVHLVASRVTDTGQVWHGRQDYRQAQTACAELEEAYGLQVAPRETTRVSRRAADHQITRGERHQALRTHVPPERVELATVVRACAARAVGGGTDAFEAELEKAGVEFEANRATTGRMSGYKFGTGRVDEAGQPVWFKASQLDKTLAWSKLSQVLDAPPPSQRVQVPEKGLLESKAKYQARVAEAQTEATQRRHQQIGQAQLAEMGEVANWWAKRNETDPRLIAHQQQILEISRIRQMMARERPVGPRQAVPVQNQEQVRPYVTPTRDKNTGMER